MKDFPSMRELFAEIIGYYEENIYEDLLLPWVASAGYYEKFLRLFENDYPVENVDLWEFYALSRVLDVLALPLYPTANADDSADWQPPRLSAAAYRRFAELLGLQASTPTYYHPFDCELVSAVSCDAAFHIRQHYFPALRLNNLLIKRGGVLVATNQNTAVLHTLNKATIYWAFWRNNRPYRDLSQGWGSNSQWATEPRIDFETATKRYYNPQGELNLATDSPEVAAELAAQGLTRAQAIELVTNRHFITPGGTEDDLNPYLFSYEEFK